MTSLEEAATYPPSAIEEGEEHDEESPLGLARGDSYSSYGSDESPNFRLLKDGIMHLSIDERSMHSPLLHKPRTSSNRNNKTLIQNRLWQAWECYDHQVKANPIPTKSITSAIVTALADMAGQSIQGSPTMDWYRTLCFFLLGLLVQAPISHFYYRLLDDQLPPTPQPWTKTTFIKLAIDQLIFAPSFLIMVFLFLDTMQQKNFFQHLKEGYALTMVDNWMLWCPSTLVNMAFCPPRFRVLYNNVIFFVWSICLSIILN